MALVGVNNRDASGFSYVDGQFNNFEYITIDGDLYPALKMSNDESVTIYVMYLGKAL